MGFVEALEVHDEEPSSHTVDVVDVVDQLHYVLLGDLPVAGIAKNVLGLHDRLDGLFSNSVVVVL